MAMASSVVSSKHLIGHICSIEDLIKSLMKLVWRRIEFQVYQNITNYVIRHTGVRITLISVDEGVSNLVFTLDWGLDGGVGRLQIAILLGEILLKHNRENTLLADPLRIPLHDRSIRVRLVQIFSEMWDHFDNMLYNSFPLGSGMNCRGFCTWLMDKLECLQSSDGEATKAKEQIDAVDNTDKWWSLAVGLLLVLWALIKR